MKELLEIQTFLKSASLAVNFRKSNIFALGAVFFASPTSLFSTSFGFLVARDSHQASIFAFFIFYYFPQSFWGRWK
jgi:phosphotransferase system  glucose/maltose/N-acetylglucosamine-specific IIC component